MGHPPFGGSLDGTPTLWGAHVHDRQRMACLTEIIEVPNPFDLYDVRGVGETPIVVPLVVVSNAERDQLGFRIPDLPLSPPRDLEAIDKQGGDD